MTNPLPIVGLVHVTGEPDTGKTTLTLATGVAPGDVAFFDDDLKTQAVADQLAAEGKPFGLYFNVHREFAQFGVDVTGGVAKPVALHDLVTRKIRELPDGRFRVLVFDNWTRMEAAIRAHSLAIMPEISDLTPGQIRNMTQLTWPYTYNYYAQVLDLMLSRAPLVFLTTHVREQYVGNQKTGKLEPRGQRPLAEKSSLRLWLRHNPDGPEPVGLVLKRVAKFVATDRGLKPISVLPRRVKPCTWDKIKWYFDNPVGSRELEPDEVPNAFEMSILDGTLTEDQKNALRLAVVAARQDAALTKEFEEELMNASKEPSEAEARRNEIKALLGTGKTRGEVIAATGASLLEVVAAERELAT